MVRPGAPPPPSFGAPPADYQNLRPLRQQVVPTRCTGGAELARSQDPACTRGCDWILRPRLLEFGGRRLPCFSFCFLPTGCRQACSSRSRVYCRVMTEHPGLITPLSPMLHVCSEEGCSAIVLGSGTCVEHDQPPSKSMTSTL